MSDFVPYHKKWQTPIYLLLMVGGSAVCHAQPDILNPGPQLPTYPTNTGTLPEGRAYFELAPFNYEGKTQGEAGKYYTQFLAHYGLIDNIELRVYGSGLTWSEGKESNTAFAPLSFSAVISIWSEHDDYPYLPAFSIETLVNTQWLGNSETNSGTNPGVQFAFSKDIPFDTNLNISMGPVRSTQGVDVGGRSINEYHWDFLFQWALQKDLIDNKLSVFAHGYYNGSADLSIPPIGSHLSRPDMYGVGKTVIGGGLIWTVNDRFSIFGQVSGGTNTQSPSMVSWSGFAVAF